MSKVPSSGTCGGIAGVGATWNVASNQVGHGGGNKQGGERLHIQGLFRGASRCANFVDIGFFLLLEELLFSAWSAALILAVSAEVLQWELRRRGWFVAGGFR